MDSPFIIPLAALAMVALIVGITQLAGLREKEAETFRRIQSEEMEHKRKMRELDEKLARLKPVQ